MIQLVVNGKQYTVEEPMSISGLLASRELDEHTVVVEHNREIVPRDSYDEVMLRTGDTLEIVRMMAGG